MKLSPEWYSIEEGIAIAFDSFGDDLSLGISTQTPEGGLIATGHDVRLNLGSLPLITETGKGQE